MNAQQTARYQELNRIVLALPVGDPRIAEFQSLLDIRINERIAAGELDANGCNPMDDGDRG